ncbi:Centromere/kinetochore Zw10-domain-containing protein [Fennellomyces sp. T-0311]|nr:Centromere/kinetochore Zw10-domain-containing protein [Fennellomyces sp. T-0311]
MSTARVQQEFISAIFEDNSERDILLQSQQVESDALVSILNGLEQHTNVLRQQVFETVRDNLDSFISLYSGCHQVHTRLDGILEQCQARNDDTTDPAQHIAESLRMLHETEQRSAQNQEEIKVLEALSNLVKDMNTCEQQLAQAPVQEVTRRWLAVDQALAQQQEWGSQTVTCLLNEKNAQLKEKLIETLKERLTSAIVYKQEPRSMQVYPTGKETQLLDIFECFSMLDILSGEMATVKRSMMKNIVAPFFEHCDNAQVTVQGNTLSLDHAHQGTNNYDIACVTIQNVDRVLKFISTQCFGGHQVDAKMVRLFGNLILPEIFQQLISRAIAPAVPSTAAELSNFDCVADAARVLEANCIQQYGFFDSSEPSSIIIYVENIDTHFANKRRDKVLLEGRRVMLRKLYEVEDVADLDPKTNMPQRYQITQTPQLLSLLLIDTAKEAAILQQSHPVSASKLLDVIFDLLDLFRAIMPQFHRSQFLSSPQSSLVFRNDCYWLANTLTMRLLETVDSNKKNDLKDSVLNVRILGESWFELAMAQWVRVLQDALNKTGKFVGIAENRQLQQTCDAAIEQVIDQIRSYAVTLRPVISERVYFDLVSRVVDSVLTRLLGDIEDLSDIGAEDSHLIAQSLNSLIQVVDVFDTNDQPATEPVVMNRVPSWRKFWHMKDMLEMNLRDIMDLYRRGELYMFEKKELIHLICALFADTELRASMIREIQTTNPPPPNTFHSPIVEQVPPEPVQSPPQPQQTPKTGQLKLSSLAMVQDDDDMGGDGWGWDDADENMIQEIQSAEPSPPSTTHPSPPVSQQVPAEPARSSALPQVEKPKPDQSKATPLSMVQYEDEGGDGWGWGDADEDVNWDNVH